MKLKAKLVHKYQEQNGVSQNTGNAWRRQEMKFIILRDDFSETNETIVASCTNALIIDAPVLKEGTIGILSVWMNAEEYNGRCYNRVNMNGWTPQNEINIQAAQSTAQPAQTFTPEQLAAAAAMLQQNGGKLPF